MIPLEKLRAVRVIVTHKNCPDGLASAVLLHDALPDAEIVFLQYGTPEYLNLEPRPGMLFCDIAPYADGCPEVFRQMGAIVLDHHKGARDLVESFGADGVFADEATEPGVSGAALAFREVWHPLNLVSHASIAHRLAALAGIRDTWQTGSPSWQTACEQAEVLHFWGAERLLAVKGPFRSGSGFLNLFDLGPILLEKKLTAAREALERALRATTAKGTRVILFEGKHLTSDAAEACTALAQAGGRDADLVVGFGYEVREGRPRLIVSTRSHTNFDCLAFAKANGGGGHTRAAGFVLEGPEGSGPQLSPYTEIVRAIVAFESAR